MALEIDQTVKPRPRSLWIAFGVFAIVQMAFIATGIIFFVDRQVQSHDHLGDYVSPRQILSTRPDRTMPATLEQGMLVVRGFRCVRGDSTVVVQQAVTFRPVGEPARTPVSDPPPGQPLPEVARSVGCYDQDILLLVPPAVGPGKWYIEAAERVPSTGEIRTWFSETFEVVAR